MLNKSNAKQAELPTLHARSGSVHDPHLTQICGEWPRDDELYQSFTDLVVHGSLPLLTGSAHQTVLNWCWPAWSSLG